MKDILKKILSAGLVCGLILGSCPANIISRAEEVSVEQPAEEVEEVVQEEAPKAEPAEEPAPEPEPAAEEEEAVPAAEETPVEAEPKQEEAPEEAPPAAEEPAEEESAPEEPSEDEPSDEEDIPKDEEVPEDTPVPEETAEPTATPEPTPVPTEEPTPEPTAVPTATPVAAEKTIVLKDVYAFDPIISVDGTSICFEIEQGYALGLTLLPDEIAARENEKEIKSEGTEPELIECEEELNDEEETKIVTFSDLSSEKTYEVWAKAEKGSVWNRIDLLLTRVLTADLKLNDGEMESSFACVGDVLSVETNSEDADIEWYRGETEDIFAEGAVHTVSAEDAEAGAIRCRVLEGELEIAVFAVEVQLPEPEAGVEQGEQSEDFQPEETISEGELLAEEPAYAMDAAFDAAALAIDNASEAALGDTLTAVGLQNCEYIWWRMDAAGDFHAIENDGASYLVTEADLGYAIAVQAKSTDDEEWLPELADAPRSRCILPGLPAVNVDLENDCLRIETGLANDVIIADIIVAGGFSGKWADYSQTAGTACVPLGELSRNAEVKLSLHYAFESGISTQIGPVSVQLPAKQEITEEIAAGANVELEERGVKLLKFSYADGYELRLATDDGIIYGNSGKFVTESDGEHRVQVRLKASDDKAASDWMDYSLYVRPYYIDLDLSDRAPYVGETVRALVDTNLPDGHGIVFDWIYRAVAEPAAEAPADVRGTIRSSADITEAALGYELCVRAYSASLELESGEICAKIRAAELPDAPAFDFDYEREIFTISAPEVHSGSWKLVIENETTSEVKEFAIEGESEYTVHLDAFVLAEEENRFTAVISDGVDREVRGSSITVTRPTLTQEQIDAASVQLDGQKASCADGYELRLIAGDGTVLNMVGGQFSGMVNGAAYSLQLRAKGSNAAQLPASHWAQVAQDVTAAVPDILVRVCLEQDKPASKAYIGDVLRGEIKILEKDYTLPTDAVCGWMRMVGGTTEIICQDSPDEIGDYTVTADDADAELCFFLSSAAEAWSFVSEPVALAGSSFSLDVDYEKETITVTMLTDENCDLKLAANGAVAYASGTKSISAALSALLEDTDKTDEEIEVHILRNGKEIVETLRLKARPAFEAQDAVVSVGEIGPGSVQLSCSDAQIQPGLASQGKYYWADENGLVTGLVPDSSVDYIAVLRLRGSNAQRNFASVPSAAKDESGEEIVVHVQDAFYVTLSGPAKEADGSVHYDAQPVNAANNAENISCEWYAVDLAGNETKLEKSGLSVSFNAEEQKALFFKRLKLTSSDGVNAAEATSDAIHADGLAYSIDYEQEALLFTAPSAPVEDCVLYLDGAALQAWPAGETQLRLPLASLNLPRLGSAYTGIYSLIHELSDARTADASLVVPARPVPSADSLSIRSEADGIEVSGVLEGWQVGFSLEGEGEPAEAADVVNGTATASIGNASTAVCVFIKTPADSENGRFASAWTLVKTIRPQLGFTLSASAVKVGETVTATPSGDYADVGWQWYRGSSAISGATKASYTTVWEDLNAELSVVMRVGDFSATQYVQVGINAPKVKVDYEAESVTLTLSGTLGKGWSVRAYNEDGGKTDKSWPSGKSSASFTLKQLGVGPDAFANSAPDYAARFLLVSSTGVEGPETSVTLPTRAKYSGSGANWGSSRYLSPTEIRFSYDDDENLAMSLKDAKAPDLSLGMGPVIGGLKESTAYYVWMQDKAVAGKKFASEWKALVVVNTRACTEVTASLKNSSFSWKPDLNSSLEISFSDNSVTMDDVKITWFDSNGKKLSAKPTSVGNYTVEIALDESLTVWHKLKNTRFSVRIVPLTMRAGNTSIFCEPMTYNGREQLPQKLNVSIDGVEIPSTEFNIGKISGQNYINVGSHTASVTGKGNVSGSVNMIYSISKAKPGAITWPTASQITYGQALSKSTLKGGSTSMGSFAWENKSIIPSIGTKQYRVVFTPADTVNYDWTGIEVRRLVSVKIVSTSSGSSGGYNDYDDGYSGSSGGNYNYDDDVDTIDDVLGIATDYSDQLTEGYLGASGSGKLEIVYDEFGAAQDYELAPILRYPEVDDAMAAQMTEEELEAALEPKHTLMVSALPDMEGEIAARSFLLSLRQVDHLKNLMEFKSLLFRNGDMDIILPMEELLSGKVSKLAKHMLILDEEEADLTGLDVSALDLDALYPEDVILDAGQIKKFHVETRIKPVLTSRMVAGLETECDAWEIGVWLIMDAAEVEISTLLPGFAFGISVDGMFAEEEVDNFLQTHAIARRDPEGLESALLPKLLEMPGEVPSNQPDESEYYMVSMPVTEGGSIWTDYVSNFDLSAVRRDILAIPYVGGGVYFLMEVDMGTMPSAS